MNKFFGLLFFYAVSNCLSAQSDSLTLEEVVILSSRIEGFSNGVKFQEFDSTDLLSRFSDNVGELLMERSPVFIKSYGPGTLSTTSFRGGNANQTPLIWNGLNITNPMNGTPDMALIPLSLIRDVKLQYGGASTSWGSGAVTGAILLNSKTGDSDNIEIHLGAGSFGKFTQGVELNLKKNTWQTSLSVFNQFAENNFPIQQGSIRSEIVRERQVNASYKNSGLIASVGKEIIGGHMIKLDYWLQRTQREIPPTLLEEDNNSEQEDLTNRIMATWNWNRKNGRYETKAAFFQELLQYQNPTGDLVSNNRSNTFILESNRDLHFNRSHSIQAGINGTFAYAKADSYKEDAHQNRISVFGSYSIQNKDARLAATTYFRQEYVDNGSEKIPFTYGVSGKWNISPWLKLYLNGSRVYRVPTLNDLFWQPGGNPDLKPERGYSIESGVAAEIFQSNKEWNIRLEATGFSRQVKDQIIWLPSQSYWTPQNLVEVWSRGLETTTNIAFSRNRKEIGLQVLTNYVLATNQRSKVEGDASVGKQIIYTPRYNGSGKFYISAKNVVFSVIQSYTGYRFTSSDNSEWLNPFWLTSIRMEYAIRLRTHTLKFNAEINNLFSNSYQIVAERAMPLQNFELGISLRFSSKTK